MALLEKQTKQDKGKFFTISKSITFLSSEIYLGSSRERFQVSYVFSYQLKAIRHIKVEANAFLHIYIYASTSYIVPGKAWSQAVISLCSISVGECRQWPCRAWQATSKCWLLLLQATPGWNQWEVHPGVCTFSRKQKNATNALLTAKPTWPPGLSVVDCCTIN